MNIKQVIMHTLHTDENKCILSDVCLPVTSEKPFKQIERKITSVFKSNNSRVSTFASTSNVLALLEGYLNNEQSFLDISKELATLLFHHKYQNGLYTSSTFIIAEVVMDERRYIVGIDTTLKKAMRLCIRDEEGEIINDLEEYSQLFSPAISSKDFVFTYDLLNKELRTIESAQAQEKETYNILSTVFLEAVSEYSYRQGMKMLNYITDKVVEEYDLDPLKVKPKIKQYVFEHVQDEEVMDVVKMADEVLEDYPLARHQMILECEKVELGTLKNITNQFSKSDQMQKFVTDIGIEIYVPLDYINNKNVIDIDITEEDLGTITIKNIASILSK